MKEEPDINDTLRTAGEAAARERHDHAQKYHSKDHQEPPISAPKEARWRDYFHPDDKGSAQKFPLLRFDQIKVDTQRRGYLIKGLIASTGLTVVWGPPKCGKSFVAVDMALHIALGWKYRGRRVQKAPVVYIALEGQHGLPARVAAFKRSHSVTTAPFYLILVRLNLIADVAALIAEIKAQIGAVMPGAVFIDTLNRSLVGSESKDEDMARYLAAADRLGGELSCAVILVHHCGIDATRPRGHTSLTGSVESQLAVKKGEADEVIVTVEYAKDFAEGTEVYSRLEPATVGTDPDGDEITTLVVLPAQGAPRLKRPKVKGQATVALDALHDALNEVGEIGPPSTRIPPNTRTIPVVRWRDYFDAMTVKSDKKPDSRRKAFQRAAERLQTLKIIGVWKDRAWLAGQAGQ
jgi:hypothetical protein